MNPVVQALQAGLDWTVTILKWFEGLNALESLVACLTFFAVISLVKDWSAFFNKLLKDRFSSQEEVRRRYLANRDRSRAEWPGGFQPRERFKKRNK